MFLFIYQYICVSKIIRHEYKKIKCMIKNDVHNARTTVQQCLRLFISAAVQYFSTHHVCALLLPNFRKMYFWIK